jgi:hypothetical protein
MRKFPVLLALAVAVGSSIVVSTTAGGASQKRITPTPNRGVEELRAAKRLARAIAAKPRQVRHASFSALPPFGDPAAISTKRLHGFPLAGRSFGILANGDAKLADNDNSSDSTSTELGGPSIRGSRDVVMLRIVFRVPKPRCLSIRFRFLSEEFPEFVNSEFNDAFIAELDVSNWSTIDKQTPNLIAPNNFAADTKGNPIAVNAVGDASVAPSRAKGTTYDAATRRLRASTPVKRGRHILYLTLFDQGDRIYDSAVFLDKLTLDNRKPCRSGAVKD